MSSLFQQRMNTELNRIEQLIVSVLGSAANSAIRPGVLLNQQTTPSSSSSSSSNTENNKNNHGNPNFLMDSLSEELGTTAENSQLAVRQNSELDAMLLGIDYDNHFDAAKQSFEDGFTDFMDRLNEIQLSLRKVVRQLANSGVLVDGKPIPYKANVYGKEKDHELDMEAASIILQQIDLNIDRLEIVSKTQSTTAPTTLSNCF